MSRTLNEIKEYRKNKLKELFNQCSSAQQDFFNRLHGSLDTIRESSIDWAIQQCERTIKINKDKEEKDNGKEI